KKSRFQKYQVALYSKKGGRAGVFARHPFVDQRGGSKIIGFRHYPSVVFIRMRESGGPASDS
ncbi:MAG TPA: hypothetical protein VFE24_00975, partial [Pirellulales bacterium]|nr:hypothetical protein [Pirellulales bacterium]